MKNIKFAVTAIIVLIYTLGTFAQTNDHSKIAGTKTETIKVSGNCESCKARIEKAAKIDGVSKAEWSKDSKILTVVYDPTKAKTDDIQKKIAAAGHDTEKYKAEDKDYNKLPGCCKYR